MLLGFTVIGMFQPEIKRMLERFGNKKYASGLLFKRNKKVNKNFSDETIDELEKAAYSLGSTKTGALIVIEKGTPLNDFIATGITIDGKITSSLLINIFEKNTPLHDGAVIIRNDEIVSATCYLPLSSDPEISKDLGTRHRAAIGIAETVDCFVIIVSEETGNVSIVSERNLKRNISKECFREELTRLQKSNYYGIDLLDKKPKKNFFKKNLAKKIAAVIIGVVLWFSLINITNPITTKTFSKIPIEVTNAADLADINKTYSIEEGQTVDLVLKGHRSVLEKLSFNDIKASVDVSKLSSVNTSEIKISIPDDIDVVSKSKSTVSVEIDNIAHAEWPVEVEQTGTVKNGYWVSGITLDNETLLISGPEMLLNKIEQVKVSVNISNKDDGAVTKVSPVLYDKNGDVMDTSKMTFNSDSINAKIHLYKTKVIGLNINVKNEPGTQGIINKIEFSPEQISVAAPDTVLNQLTDITIDVPVKIDITANNGNTLTKTINLDEYIPENVILASDDKKLSITVIFTPFSKKELELNVKDIKFINTPSNLSVSFDETQKYSVTVIAPENKIGAIKASSILAGVNLKDYKAAEYNVQPTLTAKDAFIYTDEKIKIVLKKK